MDRVSAIQARASQGRGAKKQGTREARTRLRERGRGHVMYCGRIRIYSIARGVG